VTQITEADLDTIEPTSMKWRREKQPILKPTIFIENSQIPTDSFQDAEECGKPHGKYWVSKTLQEDRVKTDGIISFH